VARVERVLIVGAGMAGLSLAIALRQRGLTAEVVERRAEGAADGAGLYLVGAGTRALAALGLGDAAARDGFVNRTQTFRNLRGARLAELDVAAYWSSCGPCLGLDRALLHRLLAAQCASSRIRYGLTVETLRQREDEVSVGFADGSSATYDFVVGADGIRSSIRRLEFGESDPLFRGQVGWRFIARRPDGIDGWTVFLGSGTAFLLLPIDGDRAYVYADRVTPRPVADPPEGRIERLRELFRDFAKPVRQVLAEVDTPERLHFAAIEEVVHEPWGRGRVLLIGDAAHAMSPNMACGAAMAFEDSLVLAELIAKEGAASEIVSEFTRRRSARLRWLRRQTDRRDRLRRLSPLVRDVVLRLLADRTYRANYEPLLAPP
jgi:2-polyprenyl-6-methoxyphenol hydroxylase-like FAD-dependent oxidoreductase